MVARLIEIVLKCIEIPIVIALVTILINNIIEKNKEKRKSELDFINKQINEFYGPLYILTKTGTSLFNNLWFKTSEKKEIELPSTYNNHTEWRLWVENIFLPMNAKIEEIILKNGYLIKGNDMEKCLTDFIVHSSQYKIVVKKWENNDFTQWRSASLFPSDLNVYIEQEYMNLKRKQNEMIHILYKNIDKYENVKHEDNTSKMSFNLKISEGLYQAQYLINNNDYEKALYILFLLTKKRDRLNQEQEHQLWNYFDIANNEYVLDKKTLEDNITGNAIRGLINYNLTHEKIGDVYYEKAVPEFRMKLKGIVNDKDINIDIPELYEEVEVISYAGDWPSTSERRNNPQIYYEVRIKGKNEVFIESKYLWFYPTEKHIGFKLSY